MTPEEAMKWFKNDLKDGKCSDDCPQCNANEIAIKALEKQIPHALAPKESDCAEIPRCGKCGGIMDLMQGELNYCPNCGQALDWEE